MDREPRLNNKRDIEIRLEAVSQMSVVAALMTGAAISSLTVELPEDYPFTTAWLDGYLMSTSLTTACSLVLLFQSTMEYVFCMRLLGQSNYPAPSETADKVNELFKELRPQRRFAEICFAIAVPMFALSAGTLVYVKARILTKKWVGLCCVCILGVTGLMTVKIMVASQRAKKKVEGRSNSKWMNPCLLLPCYEREYVERSESDKELMRSSSVVKEGDYRNCESLANAVQANGEFSWASEKVKELKLDGELVDWLDNATDLDDMFKDRRDAGHFEKLKLFRFLKQVMREEKPRNKLNGREGGRG